jgi:hypothetical protein
MQVVRIPETFRPETPNPITLADGGVGRARER